MSNLWQALKSAVGGHSALPRARRRRVAAPRNPYRACAIIPGQAACEAVEQLREKRILLADVPLVPLPDCDRLKCDCRYRHFEDRRNQERRLWGTQELRMWGDAPGLHPQGATERRRRACGRRADDHAP